MASDPGRVVHDNPGAFASLATGKEDAAETTRQQLANEGAGCLPNRICKKSMTHDVDSHSACASVVGVNQQCIRQLASVRLTCMICPKRDSRYGRL